MELRVKTFENNWLASNCYMFNKHVWGCDSQMKLLLLYINVNYKIHLKAGKYTMK